MTTNLWWSTHQAIAFDLGKQRKAELNEFVAEELTMCRVLRHTLERTGGGAPVPPRCCATGPFRGDGIAMPLRHGLRHGAVWGVGGWVTTIYATACLRHIHG